MRISTKWGLRILMAGAVVLAGCDRDAVRMRANPAVEGHPPVVHHVVVISIDGCRPDVLLMADAPNVHRMIREGAYDFLAETTEIAITLPSHTSMVTGVPPEVHGIFWNVDAAPEGAPKQPLVPTIFDIAHENHLTTGMATGKSKFSAWVRNGNVDYNHISEVEKASDDEEVGRTAAAVIMEHAPNFLFVHLANNDIVGHKSGWGSPEQFEAVHHADAAVGFVREAIHEKGLDNDCMVIVTADHGGAGLKHGAAVDGSRFIPWICVGPGVREEFDLSRSMGDRPLRTEDTFATSCYLLGLPVPAGVVGRPVMAIFRQRDLMEPASVSAAR